jgi:glycosyltransferase involved in cell wall biosynthesis
MVSVLLPVLHCEPYVGEALQSVLTQAYGNLEVVVMDDGSTGATAARRAVDVPARAR